MNKLFSLAFSVPFLAALNSLYAEALYYESFGYDDGELIATSGGNWEIEEENSNPNPNPNLNVVDGELVFDFTGTPADPP